MEQSSGQTVEAGLWGFIRLNAQSYPDKLAFQVIDADLNVREAIAFGTLYRRSLARARQLQELGISGQTIALVDPTGVDFITNFFAVLATGGTAVPLNSRLLLNAAALRKIVENAQIVAVLGDRASAARLSRNGGVEYGIQVTTPLEVDSTAENLGSFNNLANEVAVIQYTSGSTSDPKGVCVSHAAFVANARLLSDRFVADESDIAVSWLPFYHDMGLMTGLVWPTVQGAAAVLMRPSTFSSRPACWLQAISKFRGTISAGPDFAFQLSADAAPEGLDLSAWRIAICGAEPVRPATIERFIDSFAPAGFDRRALFPSYGLAEATLFVSGGPRRTGPRVLDVDRRSLHDGAVVEHPKDAALRQPLVSCGRVGAEIEVKIVSSEGVPLPSRKVGEIWLNGPSISSGYKNMPTLNAEIFGGQLEGDARRYLRTGDLGFLDDGDLFIVGRVKDILILRGSKYLPQDLEMTCAQSHPALEGCSGVAFVDDDRAHSGIVFVQEVRRGYEGQLDEVATAIAGDVARVHGVSVDAIHLIPFRALPLTSSGKVRRQPTRLAFVAGAIQPLATWRRGAGAQVQARPAAHV